MPNDEGFGAILPDERCHRGPRRLGFNDDAIGANIGLGLVIEILAPMRFRVPRRWAAQPFAADIVRRHGPALSQWMVAWNLPIVSPGDDRFGSFATGSSRRKVEACRLSSDCDRFSRSSQ